MNPTLWLVACAVGLAVLAALAVVQRRAAARRELELVDEILAADEDRAPPRVEGSLVGTDEPGRGRRSPRAG